MPNNNRPLDEQLLDQLDRMLPAASGFAFANAYQQAVHAGLSVVVSEGGAIYEVFPDGQRRKIKSIAPPFPAQPGQMFTIS